MCGIAGIYKKDGPITGVANILDQLSSRGPDDRGIYETDQLTLGHVRLSIIDLSSKGHQPMESDCGRYVLVYNGEIYNFRELREELKDSGVLFNSDTDSEVLLKLIQYEGIDAIKRLNGMYAFALLDTHEKTLTMVRDPFGIKPLYYYHKDDTLVFASQVKAFETLPDLNLSKCDRWETLFLAFGYLPAPYTTFKEVKALERGCLLQLDLNTASLDCRRWYELQIHENQIDYSEIKEKCENAVKRHLIADVPTGIFLSGGIDSSLLALIASQHVKHLETLSIEFEESNFSESYYQNIVAAKINGSHKEVLISYSEFVNSYKESIDQMDQPTLDGINTFYVSKAAKKQKLKVVLSGLGADEIFYGYRHHKIFPKLKYLSWLRFLFRVFALLPFNSKFKKLEYFEKKSSVTDYLGLRGVFSPSHIAKELGIDKRVVWETLLTVEPRLPKNLKLYSKKHCSFLDFEFFLAGQLLKDSDFMSMSHSLELRVPFLDKELVELAFKTSDEEKFIANYPKSMLTKPFSDLLPDEIVFRPKQGFTFPFRHWLKEIPEMKIYNISVWPRNWAVFILDLFRR